MAILFALYTLLGWGSGDIFIAKVSRKIGNIQASFWWMAMCLLISSFYIPFAGPISDFTMLFIAFLINGLGFAGTFLYIRALEKGNASLVGTISGAFALITVPLSVILFGEKVLPIQMGGIILILCGLILATLPYHLLKKRNFLSLIEDKSNLSALFVMLLWGVYWCIIRIPVTKIGWFWPSIVGNLYLILFPFFGLVGKKVVRIIQDKKTFGMIITMSLLTITANFSYNIGITYGFTSFVAPIAGASPVLFVALSRFVFHEPLTRQQKVGILLTLSGIVLVGLSG